MTNTQEMYNWFFGYQIFIDDEDEELSNTVVKIGKRPNRIFCNTFVFDTIKKNLARD